MSPLQLEQQSGGSTEHTDPGGDIMLYASDGTASAARFLPLFLLTEGYHSIVYAFIKSLVTQLAALNRKVTAADTGTRIAQSLFYHKRIKRTVKSRSVRSASQWKCSKGSGFV